MNPYECFQEYISLKTHFTSKSYDYFKYTGKIRANIKSFENRKDQYFFKRLSKHRDPHGYLLSNMIDKSFHLWVGELFIDSETNEIYENWIKRNQSLSYYFDEDLKKLNDRVEQNFIIKNGNHPSILNLYLSKEISLESFVIILDIMKAIPYFDKKLKHDVIWQDLSLKCQKYLPFIKFDRDKFSELIRKRFV